MALKSRPKSKDAQKKSLLKKPWFYATAVGTAGAIALGTWGFTAYNKPEPVAPAPPSKIVELSVDSPAYAWVTSLDEKTGQPSDVGGTPSSTPVDRTTPLVPDLTCSILKAAPEESLYTGVGTLNDSKFTVQILGPGTSGKIFSNIVKDSGSCWPKKVEQKEGKGYRYVEAGDGFIAQIGDTLVYTAQSDVKKATVLFDSISASLTKSGCVATGVKDSDYTRNEHFSGKEYTGLTAVESIESTLPLDKLPVVTVPALSEIENPDAKEPEGPLDPSIPSAPDDVTKPSFSERPDLQKEPFKAEARYQVSDVEGPGCGWGWTAWDLPTETDEMLAKSKSEGIASAQDSANEQANAYLEKQADWAGGRLTDAQNANAWNGYAQEFNAAAKKWSWLDSKREALKPKWDDYVKKHDYWHDFEQIKSDKEEEYRAADKQCDQANKDQEDWDDRYDGTSGDTGNSGIPKRPAGCDKEPKAPAILRQDRPKEPLPPKLEAGVTVPESWNQPK